MEGKKLVDLHFHSVYSDGSEKIPAIIKEAKARGVVALALTDHNNGAGVPKFMAACQEAGIMALEGTEIYASFSENPWSWNVNYCGPAPDVVILGKKLKWDDEFKRYQEMLVSYYYEHWLPKTLSGLQDAGLKVPTLTREEMWDQVKDFGTPRVLHDVPKNPANWQRLWEICYGFDSKVKPENIAQSPVRWANRHLYAFGKKAWVLRAPQDFSVKRAVKLANAMNGVLFAAHPGGEYGNWSEKHLAHFVTQGGKGIEAYQYFHSQAQIEEFSAYAKNHKLLVSGGSDYHGKNGLPTLGCWDKPANQTPFEVYETLMAYLR